MSWLILILAGLFEIGWAIGLKHTDGFTRFWPSIITLVALTISILLLGIAVRHLPIGTAYAVWVGIGTVGTVISGILFFQESMSAIRMLSLILIVLGIVGLKIAAGIKEY